MIEPTPYARMPRLPSGALGDSDDLSLSAADLQRLLEESVRVEEKLDGMNVAIVLDDVGWPMPVTRSGRSTGDRAGQLGRMRGWIGERAEVLQALLVRYPVLYGEWLRRRHTIAYDALPDWLVVLDLEDSEGGRLSPSERDRVCAASGLATPPVVFEGVLGSVERIPRLVGCSNFGSGPAEGAVIRASGMTGLIVAKWLAPSFSRITDVGMSANLENSLSRADPQESTP